MQLPSMRIAPGPVRRVLVIEDDQDVADVFRRLAMAWGHEVRVERDGLSGVEAARAFLPEVVLCEVALPRLDGHGVARALRADPLQAGIFLVALGTSASPEDLAGAWAAGFDLQLPKAAAIALLEQALAAAQASGGGIPSAPPAA